MAARYTHLNSISSGRNVRIILDRRVLSDAYVPETLPGRDEQILMFEDHLEPLLFNEPPSHLAFNGMAGTGKTAVAKHVLRRKSEELRGAPVRFIYINCSQANTSYRVMYQLNRAFGILIPPSGYPYDVLEDNFKKAFLEADVRLFLVLDEVDLLVRRDGGRLLYSLTRMNYDLDLRRNSVTVLGISNTLNFLERLDRRVRSSYNPDRIFFQPYTADELYNILLQRARLGLRPGSWEDAALRRIAAKVAREGGDARRAIDLLRMAAILAEKDRSGRLTEDHVSQAEIRVDESEVQVAIRTLPFHHLLVLKAAVDLLLAGDPRPGTGKIYERYERYARRFLVSPLTMRRVSAILRELESQGILEIEMSYGGARGNTKVVRGTALPPLRLKEILNEVTRV